MKRIFPIAGSVVVAGALTAIWTTMRDGPQPKVGPQCTGIVARCDEGDDGGLEYQTFTVVHGSADASAIDWLTDRAESRGCVMVGAFTLDGGMCAAQPNAVRRVRRANAQYGCRCDGDGGPYLVPCTVLGGDQDLTRFGCWPAANRYYE